MSNSLKTNSLSTVFAAFAAIACVATLGCQTADYGSSTYEQRGLYSAKQADGAELPSRISTQDPQIAVQSCEDFDADTAEYAACRAHKYLLATQDETGSWHADMLIDSSINAWYIAIMRLMGTVNYDRERLIISYMMAHQEPDGGWSLFSKHEAAGSDFNVTLQNYVALKLAGYAGDLSRTETLLRSMDRTAWINTISMLFLCLSEQLPKDYFPYASLRIFNLPTQMPINLHRMGVIRTMFIPLLLVSYLKYERERSVPDFISELLPANLAGYKNASDPEGLSARELLDTIPKLLTEQDRMELVKDLLSRMQEGLVSPSRIFRAFHQLDKTFKPEKSLEDIANWIIERQEDDGNIGGVAQYTMIAMYGLHLLNSTLYSDVIAHGISGIETYQSPRDGGLFQNFSQSHMFDTGYSIAALAFGENSDAQDSLSRAEEYLFKHTITTYGDWSAVVPGVEPGGWAFQPYNQYSPDVDSTAIVLKGVCALGDEAISKHTSYVSDSVNWILAMQNSDGGWSAYDKDNAQQIVEFMSSYKGFFISNEDITGRVLNALGCLGYSIDGTSSRYPQRQQLLRGVQAAAVGPAIARAVEYLKAQQIDGNHWFGQWFTNYTYGTSQVLLGLKSVEATAETATAAVRWLVDVQNADGGWGESARSYQVQDFIFAPSTVNLSAFVIEALVAYADEFPEARAAADRGVEYLLGQFDRDAGHWSDDSFTATFVPRQQYGSYTALAHYYPLIAVEKYLSLQ